MDLGLEGRSVLVAAASRGIGKATALAFLREGARVTICSRDGKTLADARDELAGLTGGSVLAQPADVSDAGDLAALVESARKAHGDVEILVNNAGGPPMGDHTTVTEDQWDAHYQLTLLSAIRLTNLVLPAMKTARWGRVVNVSSYSVKQPLDNMMLSNSLRLAVLGWSKTLATEVAGDGITINTVCPGWTRTDRVISLLQARANETGLEEQAVQAAIESNIPARRLADPAEIAAGIVFLASTSAGYITGTALPIDGGAARTY